MTMKSVRTGEPGEILVVDVPHPDVGEDDVLIRMRACGICGTDVSYVQRGGVPGPAGPVPGALGHEPAGEIVEVGARVSALSVGDRVVVNPMAAHSGVIGNGGRFGALSEYLLIENAEPGKSLALIPDTVPFEVAALNEPMAVAKHFVNRADPAPQEKVVVFGAGPIGLGASIWLKQRGVAHVVVADVIPARLQRALAVGADAVINSAEEDIAARLTQLHGESRDAFGAPRPGTDIYMDAAGVDAVIHTAIACAKWRARLVMAAFHKTPTLIDTALMLSSELTFLASMGYPTEIFEVTPAIAEDPDRFKLLISDVVPFDEVDRAFDLALTPGSAEKVVVTFAAGPP